jgi:sugar transferase (PEP-CTERM system associated)
MVGAVYASAYLRDLDKFPNLPQYLDPLLLRALLFASSMTASMFAMGLYQGQLREGVSGILMRLSISFFIGIVILSIVSYVSQTLLFGRGVLSIALIISFLLIILLRSFFLKTVDESILRRRVLVLGAAERAANFTRLRRKSDHRGFNIIGFIHIEGEQDIIDENRVLALDGPLLDKCLKLEIDEIVVAITDRRKKFPVHELLDCRLNGIDVVDALTFFERETGKIIIELLNPSWLIFSEGWTRGAIRSLTHRFFDIFLCFLLLLLTWPFLILTTIAIAIEGGFAAPVLYRQVRIGQNGKPFQLLKFRSMHAVQTIPTVELGTPDPSRVTIVGSIIRKFRIDELPQIYNILKGDMRFVGPRPERPELVTLLSEKIPYYDERHLVKPGLAGWAQLNYPYGSTEKDALEKLQFDLFYVKNHSLVLDLFILAQTVEVVIFGKGSR